MKKSRKFIGIASLLLALILAITGCGSGMKESVTGGYYYNGMEDSEGMDYDSDYSYPDYEYKEEQSGSVKPNSTNFVRESNEKLIYTCRITIETLTFDQSLAAVNDLIAKYEGFIQSEEQYDRSENWYYSDYKKTHGTLVESVTIRIPTKNYDAFLKELSASGNVRQRNQSVENITTAYHDTETTIQSLRIQEKRLLEMLESCTEISDMITVESRLSDVQNQLAIYQNRLNTMDHDVAYSTVHLSLEEVMQYTPEEAPRTTFFDRLKYTLKDSWSNTLDFSEELLFFLIYAAPILLIIAILVLIIVLIVRSATKKSKARRIAAAQKRPNQAVRPQVSQMPQTPQAPQNEENK